MKTVGLVIPAVSGIKEISENTGARKISETAENAEISEIPKKPKRGKKGGG